jgi:hypothetical protein
MSVLVDIEYGVKLVATTCGACHIPFAMPEGLERKARADEDTWFHCPNGHRLHYTTAVTARERLERELTQAKADKERVLRQRDAAQAARDDARMEAEHQRSRANGYKGALAKTKKRIGRGVCPGCNRHFANVERHMQSMHPDLAADHAQGAKDPPPA